ncbi:MAG: hypothetical protein V2A73_14490 [Pseudomonadota bacterium]
MMDASPKFSIQLDQTRLNDVRSRRQRSGGQRAALLRGISDVRISDACPEFGRWTRVSECYPARITEQRVRHEVCLSPPIMPSLLHEAFALLVRQRPTIAADFLRDIFGIAVPEHSSANLEHADFTQIVPVEYRADVAILLAGEKPVFGIVVEVQLSQDPDKPRVWPLYVAALRARRDCDACVLVVTPDENVAEWARKPIAIGPGSYVTPLVLGPPLLPSPPSNGSTPIGRFYTLISSTTH